MTLRSRILTTFVAMAAMLLTGCTAIMDDLQPCPDPQPVPVPTPAGLYVHFKYDYNIQRADMFNYHCGSVTLYVFDADGKLLRTMTEENDSAAGRMPLRNHDFSIYIPDLPTGHYNFIALANQKPLAETLVGDGAKYRRTELQPGDDMTKLEVILDREEGEEAPYQINADAPMDTLWHAKRVEPFYYEAGTVARDTLSLVRDTKMLTIGLHQLEDPMNIDIDDFEILIIDKNRWLNYDNSIHEDDDIKYSPFYTWNTTTNYDEEIDKTAHASLTFNRLMTYGDATKDALLLIVDKNENTVVAQIDLPEMLAQGRNADAYKRYGRQEYLDREYDYHLDLFLQHGTWKYATVSVSILSWSVRIQNLEFH